MTPNPLQTPYKIRICAKDRNGSFNANHQTSVEAIFCHTN